MELLQPIQRVGHQEVPDLAAAEVENQRAPVRVFAQRRIGVLVQRLAVELGQGPGVLGEVGRDPVQKDADTGLMERVHQEPELIRVPEA
ncbi:hypothetical protein PJL18_03824 [Paenarthrobacter nicotinovorans]|nr:hypothetical protein [Paenarthrobacter nicotinovorans]